MSQSGGVQKAIKELHGRRKSGFKVFNIMDGWWELKIGPVQVSVWKALRGKPGYEANIHFGDNSYTQGGFDNEDEACAWALEDVIVKSERLTAQLKSLREDGV